jgi:hypothetical protein
MILSDSGNEFTARECQVDFLDTNWKVLDSDDDEVKAQDSKLRKRQCSINYGVPFAEESTNGLRFS